MAAALLAACNVSTSLSLTFRVETGDQIKVEMDTTDGYSLGQDDGEILIKKDKELYMRGVFLTEEMYQSNFEIVSAGEGATFQKEDIRDNNHCVYFQYDADGETRNACLVMVTGSKTGIRVEGAVPQEEAWEVFDRLHFKKV